jgi:orotate phosphoribosyltransferase
MLMLPLFFHDSQSPYFFNSGLLSTGPLLSTLASAYAALIASSFPKFDVLFGPAYKGISLASATALCLYREQNISVGFAFNRKEMKTHGEGGSMIGADMDGKKVLVLDDVMTAGTAVREAISSIKVAGGEVIGVVLCLDREEVGPGGTSAVKELENELGEGRKVKAVVRMQDLMDWLEKEGKHEELESMKNYWSQYGVKIGDERVY